MDVPNLDQLITFADQKTPDSPPRMMRTDESRVITAQDVELMPSQEVPTTLNNTPFAHSTNQQSLLEIIECKALVSDN